jgi:hypothetical protein
MGKHLSDEALMGVIEGADDVNTRAHLEECGLCRGLLDEARRGEDAARSAVPVPEPSPLYWDAFKRNLDQRIAEDTPRVFRAAFLVPALAAAAVVVAALGIWGTHAPRPTPSPVAPHLAAWTPLPPADDDSGLALIQAMRPSPDEIVPAAGCETASECVVDRLSEEESHSFLERMRSEKGGSL